MGLLLNVMEGSALLYVCNLFLKEQ